MKLEELLNEAKLHPNQQLLNFAIEVCQSAIDLNYWENDHPIRSDEILDVETFMSKKRDNSKFFFFIGHGEGDEGGAQYPFLSLIFKGNEVIAEDEDSENEKLKIEFKDEQEIKDTISCIFKIIKNINVTAARIPTWDGKRRARKMDFSIFACDKYTEN